MDWWHTLYYHCTSGGSPLPVLLFTPGCIMMVHDKGGCILYIESGGTLMGHDYDDYNYWARPIGLGLGFNTRIKYKSTCDHSVTIIIGCGIY